MGGSWWRPAKRGILSFIYKEVFGSVTDMVSAVLGIVSIVMGAVSVTTFVRDFTKAKPALVELSWYLWVSYPATVALIAMWVVVYRKVTHKLVELQNRAMQGAAISHKMAEAVRRAVRNGATVNVATLRQDGELTELLSSKLVEYLKYRLDDTKLAITVKYSAASERDGEGLVLYASLRYGRDKQGCKGSMSLEDSLVFKRFADAGREVVRLVYIDDVSKLRTSPSASFTSVTGLLSRSIRWTLANRCGRAPDRVSPGPSRTAPSTTTVPVTRRDVLLCMKHAPSSLEISRICCTSSAKPASSSYSLGAGRSSSTTPGPGHWSLAGNLRGSWDSLRARYDSNVRPSVP